MKAQNTIIKGVALSGVALALITLFAPRHLAVAERTNDKKAVSIFFPPISARGKIQSQINAVALGNFEDRGGRVNPPAPQTVKLIFDIFKAEPPPSPIVGTPNDNISDNPPAACAKYQWVAGQECEVEMSEDSGGSLTLSHANLQNEDYLIRAGIIIIGSEAGVFAPSDSDIVGSVEVMGEDGSTEVLQQFPGNTK